MTFLLSNYIQRLHDSHTAQFDLLQETFQQQTETIAAYNLNSPTTSTH
jgi:hypothetical protein